MAAAELRRLANDKAPLPVPSLQRWDKELVWIYCERCAAEQAMDVKSWKSSGDDSNSKLLDTASGRKKKEKKERVEIKIKKAGLSFILSIPPSLYFHRAVAILAPLLFIGRGSSQRGAPLKLANFCFELFLLVFRNEELSRRLLFTEKRRGDGRFRSI